MNEALIQSPIRLTFRFRKCGGLLVALMLTACASLPHGSALDELDYPDWLLSGVRLYHDPIDLDAEVPKLDPTDPSDAMRAYVEALMVEGAPVSRRFRLLINGLARDGYFRTAYSAHQTLTAAETFEKMGGNCLSYTNMFIALAREAGLDAVYQVVDVPPAWDADAGFLIRYTHINVLIRNVRLDRAAEPATIVDFNEVQPAAEYPRRAVSDDYAKALYYANHSVALLRAGESRASFGHLRRAIETDPTNVDLWINLGAFYSVADDPGAAIEAYQVALQLDRNSKAAFSGLARNHASLGNVEPAARYQEKVRKYRETNAYYHFAMAQAAFDDADFEGSLEYINAAIDLKRRSPRFHLLKGLVQQKLGDHNAAAESFRRARRHGLDPGAAPELRQVQVNLSAT
jgi:tetratricopeptide (TPR) repeat protein